MTIMIPAWVNGVLTPVEKLLAHERGLKHKAVSVFAINRGRILIQKRALGKYHTPGLWANTCCTHPQWDESDINCARRRLKEELGIAGQRLQFRDTLEYRADVGGGLIEHEVVAVFVCETQDTVRITPNPDEVIETRWVDIATLNTEITRSPEDFTPWLRIYMRDYQAAIFGDLAGSR